MFLNSSIIFSRELFLSGLLNCASLSKQSFIAFAAHTHTRKTTISVISNLSRSPAPDLPKSFNPLDKFFPNRSYRSQALEPCPTPTETHTQSGGTRRSTMPQRSYSKNGITTKALPQQSTASSNPYHANLDSAKLTFIATPPSPRTTSSRTAS